VRAAARALQVQEWGQLLLLLPLVYGVRVARPLLGGPNFEGAR
jgi:hypothetical protein